MNLKLHFTNHNIIFIYDCENVIIKGSNDGVHFESVLDYTLPANGNNVAHNIILGGGPYCYQLWSLEFVNWSHPNIVAISEIEIVGSNMSTTVNTNDTYCVSLISMPTLSYIGVDSVSLEYNQPVNTNIKFMFSFDDGKTWEYHNGSSWIINDLSNIGAVGNTVPQLTGFVSEWDPKLGLEWKVAVFINTNNSNTTPTFSGLYFTFNVENKFQKSSNETVRLTMISDTQTKCTNLTNNKKTFKMNVFIPN